MVAQEFKDFFRRHGHQSRTRESEPPAEQNTPETSGSEKQQDDTEVFESEQQEDPLENSDSEQQQHLEEEFLLEQQRFNSDVTKELTTGFCVTFNGDATKYEPSKFLPPGVLSNLINEETLQTRVFGRFLHPTNEQRQRISERIIQSPEPGLRAILLVILCYGSLRMMARFEHHFLRGSPDKSDLELPLDESRAGKIFAADGKTFYRRQFNFCPVNIKEATHTKIKAPCRLPYEGQTEIGNGAYGKVYRVIVARGQYHFDNPPSRNMDPAQPVVLARKDFSPDERSSFAFKAERDILRQFVNSDVPSSIVKSICSYEYKFPGVDYPLSSIIFYEAECSLNHYLNHNGYRPSSFKARRQNLRRMLDICEALVWLRNNLVYVRDEYTYMTYYHCDLKPDNILVYKNSNSGDDLFVFRLADFGEARGIETKTAFSGRQQKAMYLDVPGREGTYLAPEVQDNKKKAQAKPSSDVWSFGCILLLVIVFNRDGEGGIRDFQDARRQDSRNSRREGDHFASENDNGCKGSVTNCMKDLIKSSTCLVEKSLSEPFVAYIKKKMLVAYQERDDITKVSKSLYDMYNKSTHVKVETTHHAGVRRDAKHCTNSPNGTVFFHTPELIQMYRTDSLSRADPICPQLSSTWSATFRSRHHSSSNHAVFVAKRLNGSLKAVVVETDQQSTPSEFGITTGRAVLEQLAVSPDCKTLALAYRPSETGDCSAQICMYDRASMKNIQSDASSEADSIRPRRPSDILGQNGIVKMVQSNRDLFFSSDGRYLYHACTLKGPLTRSRPQLRVTVWDTATYAQAKNWVIDDTDTTYEGFFISSIVPLNTQIGFVCVSHGNCIRICKAESQDAIKLKDISGVKKLLLSNDDKRLVMLVTRNSPADLEIYGAYLPKLKNAWKLKILEDMTFNPKKDDANLLENGSEMVLLVTSCRSKVSYKCDVGSIFEP
ncbi:hypothetical protein AK830_g228 [Neonectria ditissima]|uniref:Protein kinase domain-containing protein n=1 Tax=Neonectria ditissima TaxID=78410 RepID=A0A0P7BZ12_9HYPO|nr:hypothetical protein AK830_g228 [Neonectria ditissima]